MYKLSDNKPFFAPRRNRAFIALPFGLYHCLNSFFKRSAMVGLTCILFTRLGTRVFAPVRIGYIEVLAHQTVAADVANKIYYVRGVLGVTTWLCRGCSTLTNIIKRWGSSAKFWTPSVFITFLRGVLVRKPFFWHMLRACTVSKMGRQQRLLKLINSML